MNYINHMTISFMFRFTLIDIQCRKFAFIFTWIHQTCALNSSTMDHRIDSNKTIFKVE